MDLKIITDNKWKNFKYGNEVDSRKDYADYDHLSEDEKYDRWIIYRKSLYHLSDFLRINSNSPFNSKKWEGYLSDSFFSGILIKVSQDGEQYKIALYMS